MHPKKVPIPPGIKRWITTVESVLHDYAVTRTLTTRVHPAGSPAAINFKVRLIEELKAAYEAGYHDCDTWYKADNQTAELKRPLTSVEASLVARMQELSLQLQTLIDQLAHPEQIKTVSPSIKQINKHWEAIHSFIENKRLQFVSGHPSWWSLSEVLAEMDRLSVIRNQEKVNSK